VPVIEYPVALPNAVLNVMALLVVALERAVLPEKIPNIVRV
jgi:hypothetical protein